MKTRPKSFYKCSKKEQIERWQNVLRVLRRLTPHQRREHWNMAIIGEKTDCGTVACAAGHCSLDTWFRRRRYTGKYIKGANGRIELDTPDEWEFFGHEGADEIFFNTWPRPVETVIEEVHAHIKKLRSEPTVVERPL